jgi:hypothetical protein
LSNINTQSHTKNKIFFQFWIYISSNSFKRSIGLQFFLYSTKWDRIKRRRKKKRGKNEE